jgi:hypothetical protein
LPIWQLGPLERRAEGFENHRVHDAHYGLRRSGRNRRRRRPERRWNHVCCSALG